MGSSSLPQYPVRPDESGEEPEPDIDRRIPLRWFVVWSLIGGFIAMLLVTVFLMLTMGQILRLFGW